MKVSLEKRLRTFLMTFPQEYPNEIVSLVKEAWLRGAASSMAVFIEDKAAALDIEVKALNKLIQKELGNG